MFNLFKKRTKEKPCNWKQEQTRLWNVFVPADGQADTLQGELIRIAGKLTGQAFRNGNMNWNADYEKMWRFVGRHLDEPATFTDDERGLIREKIEEIIRDHKTPDLSGEGCSYYIISEKVADWCIARPMPIPHKKDESLKR